MYIRSLNPATDLPLPQEDQPQNLWDPDTISNVVFGAIMVFIGLVAIWQAHRHTRGRILILDEEMVFIGHRTSTSSLLPPDSVVDPRRHIEDAQSSSAPGLRAIENIALQQLDQVVIGNDQDQAPPISPPRVTTLSTLNEGNGDAST